MKHLFTGLIALLLSFNMFGRNAFVINKGQITDQYRKPNTEVCYLYNAQQLNVQLRKSGFSYDIWQQEDNNIVRYNRIDIDFVNASPAMRIQSSEPLSDFTNYYKDYTGSRGVTDIRSYNKVLYKDVWANIDIEFLFEGDRPKYNIILHPGARIGEIKLDIKGAKSIVQNGNGLRISTAITTLEETVPNSYYMQTAGKTHVTAKLQPNSDGTYGINVLQSIPSSTTLVIDPVPTVQWGTFYGDAAVDNIESVVTDNMGYVYVAGSTGSMAAIATSGAYSSTLAGDYDAFVAKFNKVGVRIWGTYYGGGGEDRALGMALETSGLNLYLAGYTKSGGGIATIGAHQVIYRGQDDGYLAKFDSSGQLVWGTYYGDNDIDRGRCVAVDSSNNVYLSGDTRSTSNIATSGKHQGNNNGELDGFIAKFTPSGKRIWATYIGGERDEQLNSIQVVKNRIYVAGLTGSITSISTPGAFQTALGGRFDALIAKFDTAGSRIWSTYYGRFSQEGDVTAVVDENANIYVTGFTESGSGMATPGAHQVTSSGMNDGFVARFDSSGSRIWSTYYGGDDWDHPTALALGRGHLYVTGYTSSFWGIASSNAIIPTISLSGRHVFIVKYDTTGKPKWGTYYHRGEAYAIAADEDDVWVGGGTESGPISTPGSHQPTIGGMRDAFLLSVNTCDLGFAIATINNPVLINDTIKLQASGGTQYTWSHPNGFTSSLQNPSITNAKLKDTGTYTVVVTDSYNCIDTARVSVQITNSVNEILVKAFRIYPNPAATYIVVENTNGLHGTIELVAANGQLVYSTTLVRQQQKIDISLLAPGTYFIRMHTTQGMCAVKLLKQ